MNKKKSQQLLNTICLVATGIFVLGNIWLWRGEFVVAKRQTTREILVTDNQPVPPPVPQISSTKPVHSAPQIEESVPVQPVQTNVAVIEKEKDKLPVSVNLAVPFTSQAPEGNWEQPWQDACEEAAILMLDAYYKQYTLSPLFAAGELVKMVEWEESKGWGRSIAITDVAKVGEYFIGSKGRIITNPTVTEIKTLLAAGHPVLAMADGKMLENPYFSNGGPEYHALIIRGYTPTHFITNDPGTKHGEEFVYSYENVMESLHDWNDGDVQNGMPVILVLE